MGLHQDKVPSNSMHMVDVGENYSDPFKLWSTSLLVTKSDDMEGGELVLDGDGYEDYDKLGSRWKIVNLKEKGQTASWNGATVHGVTEITKGTRWVFVTFKDVN